MGQFENWFVQLKNTILEDKKNETKQVHEKVKRVESLMKEIKLDILTEGCARPKKKGKLSENGTVENVPAEGTKMVNKVTITVIGTFDNKDLVEESWKLKLQGPNSYFTSVYLQKNTPQPGFEISDAATCNIK